MRIEEIEGVPADVLAETNEELDRIEQETFEQIAATIAAQEEDDK